MIVNNLGQLLAFHLFYGSHAVMEQTAICQALERIEAALARVEVSAPLCSGLRGRHEKLKASVEKSLAEIDELIAGQETRDEVSLRLRA
jgi:hypothetical protein